MKHVTFVFASGEKAPLLLVDAAADHVRSEYRSGSQARYEVIDQNPDSNGACVVIDLGSVEALVVIDGGEG